ncbi:MULTISPECIES: transporter [unclassified Polaromonas]|jgi:hypothetical protein|uniref:transporter n=1 Tax=unclassified Polaromonas TaxID=2638319 RepID=UPI000BD392EA|nr:MULTISPECIES: transporter [unclassified Polaromonas]OYY39265.1 MAG: hypothetical protein B7Y60_03110 [Polaromonas sp. 35-63-35]OYZ20363.1 MAG: hypothetical protein B7Y28_08700 [Polaromonas sp. 16-63-31]OYZ80568.1 MAG: hypothetical protein B7Y09_05160 [Polaromonas sp. 24-63-21]OZA51631.1 MAG: hypothetical protein B7X88_08595 [Polaromonas sp. 17-63-33]OZA89899.1 MAG: hypothetical protein B7X65_00610 [Polaromonas sp. 39-63-25]
MRRFFPLRPLVLTLAAGFPLACLADNDGEVAELRRQIQELTQRVDTHQSSLRVLAGRLQQLEAAGPGQARLVRTAADGSQPDASASRDPASAEGGGAETVVREAPASRSAEAVYREQSAMFDRKFTLETGLSYSHSNRRDLFLNGFLALDAIFLGQINLDRIKADTLTFDLTGRYAPTDRLQFDINVPYLYRYSAFSSVGAGFSTSAVAERNVSNGDIGDVNAGVFYRLVQESADRPDTVLNFRIKAPTGTSPYGIKFEDAPDSGGNLKLPEKLPTGNGVWAASAGVSFIKTVDPAILFANLGYTHHFDRSFSDISSDPNTRTPGSVRLGDQFSLGAGFAFALNERMSLSTSYSHRFARKARIRQQGQDWQTVNGSDSSAGVLNFGVTYALSDRRSMVFNLGIGVTADAPDITIGVKFPFSF